MYITGLDFNLVEQVSTRDLHYVQRNENLENFIQAWPSLDSLKSQITERKNYPVNRELLADVILEQYKNLTHKEKLLQQVDRLKNNNTFTLTTAHQPSLLTGPLYYIYKICSTINLTRQLNKRYPEFHFIPIFVSGGEDHDFEEVNHFHLFGKKYIWEKINAGPVGRFTLEGLEDLLNELAPILGEGAHAEKIKKSLMNGLSIAKNYGEFVRSFCHDLFGDLGLVQLSMDHSRLKSEFSKVFEQEILQSKSAPIVNQTIQALESKGYKAQATPRDINVFFMKDGIRDRIIRTENGFEVANKEITFSEEEMKSIITNKPYLLSPNVILRPLYQELILPNLAYIGGGGELAYWIERKEQFQAFNLPFPILIRRSSAVFLNSGITNQIKKLGITAKDIFRGTDELIKSYVEDQSKVNIDLTSEKESLKEVYVNLAQKAKQVEHSLEKFVLAEAARQLKSMDNIETRIIRAEKNKHEIDINRIRNLKEKLFPENGLQERKDNFLSIYLKHGQCFLEFLIDHLNPLENHFQIISEEEC